MKALFIFLALFFVVGVGHAQVDIHIKRSLKFAKKAGKKYDKGKYKRSIALYARAIEQYPEHEFNYYHRGMAYKALGEYELAYKDFDRAILFNTESLNSYFERGLINLKRGKYGSAVKDFENHISINGESGLSLLYLTEAYIGLEEYVDGMITINKAILMEPNESDYYLKRAFCLIHQNDMKSAKKDITTAQKLGNASREFNFVQGTYYLTGGQAGKAVVFLEKAVDSTSQSIENGRYYHALSNACHASKNYEAAISAADKAIAIQPTAKYYYDRGCYLADMGNLDDALIDFSAAIEQDSTFTGAYNNRAFYIWFPRKEFQNAVEDFSKIIAIDSTNAYAYSNRSYAYFSLGNIERAFLDAFQAIDLESRNPYAYKNLALLYRAIGERDDAENAANGAVSLGFPVETDPEFKALLQEYGLYE